MWIIRAKISSQSSTPFFPFFPFVPRTGREDRKRRSSISATATKGGIDRSTTYLSEEAAVNGRLMQLLDRRFMGSRGKKMKHMLMVRDEAVVETRASFVTNVDTEERGKSDWMGEKKSVLNVCPLQHHLLWRCLIVSSLNVGMNSFSSHHLIVLLMMSSLRTQGGVDANDCDEVD